jgi:hypothetical protein
MNPRAAAPTRTRWAWGLLASRTLAFIVAQAIVVAGLAWSGVREPLWASAAWWPVAATLANVVGLALLGWRMRVEGVRWTDLLWPVPGSWRRDGLVALALLPLVALAGALPAVLLGNALWGDPAVGQNLLVGPLPAWAALVALLLFPATTAAVELPTYAGYVLPRLRAAGLAAGLAVLVVALVLGIQHGFLPFLPASEFFLWRTTMFVPFALVLIAAVAWRPRLLPWFVGVHLLLDGLAGLQVWSAAG